MLRDRILSNGIDGFIHFVSLVAAGQLDWYGVNICRYVGCWVDDVGAVTAVSIRDAKVQFGLVLQGICPNLEPEPSHEDRKR
jgi:hypothetical protein